MVDARLVAQWLTLCGRDPLAVLLAIKRAAVVPTGQWLVFVSRFWQNPTATIKSLQVSKKHPVVQSILPQHALKTYRAVKPQAVRKPRRMAVKLDVPLSAELSAWLTQFDGAVVTHAALRERNRLIANDYLSGVPATTLATACGITLRRLWALLAKTHASRRNKS